MKDQYFGDINDYRKYGLLRCLLERTGLALGVCWLLTADDGRRDGELREYLHKQRWGRYDPELYDALRQLLKDGTERTVVHAETWRLLPGATYHHRLLTHGGAERRAYFVEGFARLQECPLIFFDADNGLEVPSVGYGTKKSVKYLYWREVEEAYELGHSVVIYQHFRREPRDAFVAATTRTLRDRLAAPWVGAFRTAHAVFLMAIRQEHAEKIQTVGELVEARWTGQIRFVSVV